MCGRGHEVDASAVLEVTPFVPGLCLPSYSLVTPSVLIEFCGVAALSHGVTSGDHGNPHS
jgi:hypothetical protein